MEHPRWPGPAALATELFVVFVGLFPALQVDDWRKRREPAEHVSDSIAAGRILDSDTALVESGLIYVAHLPSIKRPSSAYEKMVASGVFARLRSTGLQKAVAELYATQAAVEADFSWWREQPIDLEMAFQPYVEYYSAGQRVKSTDVRAADGNGCAGKPGTAPTSPSATA